MPIGVITNVLAVIIGGIVGTAVGPRISERFKNSLNTIFGICALGGVVSFIVIPQLFIFLLMFFMAGVIYPYCTPPMISDFKACGGVLLLATGFRMIKVKEFPIADMIPAMLLVMPVSYLWVAYVLPVVAG